MVWCDGLLQIWPCPANGLLWVVYKCWGFAWWEKTRAVAAAKRVVCCGVQPLVAVLGTRLQCHASVVMLKWESRTFTSHRYQGTQWNTAPRNRDTKILALSTVTSATGCKGEKWHSRALSHVLDEGCGLPSERWSFRWFCRSATLQTFCKKGTPQFVFKTHQPSGKVHPQCLLGPVRGISWHLPARSMLGLQSCHQQQGPPASCCSSSEISGRLQGITRVSPTPAEEVPRSRSDTASLPGSSKPCLQSATPDPPGRSPPRALSSCSFDPKKPQLDTACSSLPSSGTEDLLPNSLREPWWLWSLPDSGAKLPGSPGNVLAAHSNAHKFCAVLHSCRQRALPAHG